MKPTTIVSKVLIWLLVIFLSFQLAFALGIRPAKTTLTPGTVEYEGEFWVVNNDGLDFSVNVYTEGEMAQYVEVEEKELTFRSDDDTQAVKFKVKLPEKVPPGNSAATIVVEEKQESDEPNVISSIIVLKHKIIIEGPYPDKYIRTKLNFHEDGDKIEFVSEVENLGRLGINSLQTTFYVNDKKQNQQELRTEPTALAVKEDKLLRATLEKDLFEQGEFEVSAVTTYDDQKVEIIKNLLVGRPEVEITYFDPYFIAQKINQYTLELLNKWNKKVENVYVEVEVKKDGAKIDDFRTKSVDIEGEMSKRIQDYFDARNKNPGKYTFEMVVNFWNTYKMAQRTFTRELLTEEEFNQMDQEELDNLAGKAAGTTGDSAYKVIVWVMLGIILGAVAFFVFWRYAHRQESGGKKSDGF